MMSELAFDANGEPFAVPPEVATWRVRRFPRPGQRGGPEIVYGDDGAPLHMSVEASLSDFRAAVGGANGRYRLDAVDRKGRPVDTIVPAYLQIEARPAGDDRGGSGGGFSPIGEPTPAPARYTTEALLAEVVRANTDMVKSMAERFPAVMEAAATLVRAADGAAMPARKPKELRNGSDEEDQDDEPAQPPVGGSAGVMSLLQTALPFLNTIASLFVKPAHGVPAAVAAFTPRNAAEGAPAQVAAQSAPTASSAPPAPSPAAPSVSLEMQAHLLAIQSKLTPKETSYVQGVAATLGAAEVAAWLAELASLPVDEAVAVVRGHISRAEAERTSTRSPAPSPASSPEGAAS